MAELNKDSNKDRNNLDTRFVHGRDLSRLRNYLASLETDNSNLSNNENDDDNDGYDEDSENESNIQARFVHGRDVSESNEDNDSDVYE